MSDHERLPHCACTIPGMVCSQHRHLPQHERPQPPLYDKIVSMFATALDTTLEAQVDAWMHEQREDH